MTNRKELEVNHLMLTHEITYHQNCIDTWKFRQNFLYEDWESAIDHATSERDRLIAERNFVTKQLRGEV
jgi:hypothetical protein